MLQVVAVQWYFKWYFSHGPMKGLELYRKTVHCSYWLQEGFSRSYTDGTWHFRLWMTGHSIPPQNSEGELIEPDLWGIARSRRQCCGSTPGRGTVVSDSEMQMWRSTLARLEMMAPVTKPWFCQFLGGPLVTWHVEGLLNMCWPAKNGLTMVCPQGVQCKCIIFDLYHRSLNLLRAFPPIKHSIYKNFYDICT